MQIVTILSFRVPALPMEDVRLIRGWTSGMAMGRPSLPTHRMPIYASVESSFQRLRRNALPAGADTLRSHDERPA